MKKIFGSIVVLALSLFAVIPLFSKGYFPMHDDTQVARVVVMAKALREGQFPVRWVSDLGYGYGYPIFNFYAPLPYYVGGCIHLLGIDSVSATKSMFIFGAVLSALTMYIFLFPAVGMIGAVVGAVLFMYAPYHASQIYVRGAVGEYWAIAFVPLLILGMIRGIRNANMTKGILIGGIGLAGTILSHTILGFVTTGLFCAATGIYWLIHMFGRSVNRRRGFVPILILFLGLGISAFFWLPAYGEMTATGVSSMVQSASTGFYDHFVCVGQLWNSPWGYAGSAPGCVDGMSFKLGKIQIITALLSLIPLFWLFGRKRLRSSMKTDIMWVGIAVAAVSIFGMLSVSAPFWRLIPFVSFIQYPWRLLTYTALGLAVMGMFVSVVSHRPIVRMMIGLCIIIVTIYTDGKLFHPKYMYDRQSGTFETREDLRFRVSKISDEYLPPAFIKPKTQADIVVTTIPDAPDMKVSVIHDTDTLFEADIVTSSARTVHIQKAYFPGWRYWLNGIEVHPTIAQGLPSVILSEGHTHITMRLTDTPIRTIGNWISILSLLSVGVAILYDKKTKT